MFTKILVAVSASSTDAVLTSAIEGARKYDAHIVALHVVDPTPCYLSAADCNYGLIVEAMTEHGRKVATHVRNVLEKLGARDRTQALAIARRRGFLEP